MTCTHRSFVRSATTWLVAMLFLCAPPLVEQAFADREQAARHYQSGRDLYSSGDYQGAIREFETANRLAPSPILDFNIGLSRERLGQLELAIQHYRAYITAMPNASNRAAVDAKIQTLEAELATNRSAAATVPGPDPGIGGRRPNPTTDPMADPTNDPSVGTNVPATDADTGTTVNPSSQAFGATGEKPTAKSEAATSVNSKRARALQRVAQVNIADVRDERAQAMRSRPPAPAVPTAATSHQDFGKKKAKPAYKKWWFWAIVGVGAYILLDLATGDSGNRDIPPPFMTNSGPVLVRF